MKKSKLLVLGLIALVLAGGLVLASCGSNCKVQNACKMWPGLLNGRECKTNKCITNQGFISGGWKDLFL